MELKLDITMDNQAFEEDANAEAARILRHAAEALRDYGTHGPGETTLRDSNGNRVGLMTVYI